MSAKQLPARPSLDQLKHQAKELLHAARQGDALARARFRVLPAFASLAEVALGRTAFALHDAQSVVAREHGFESWKALREEVEARSLEFGAALEQFLEAATDGRGDRAERILSLFPGIATANWYTGLVLGDVRLVEAKLAGSPELAVQAGGPRGWQPLHYICHSAMVMAAGDKTRLEDTARGGDKTRADGVAEIAKRLLALGADPNTRFPWEHHGVHRPVLWGAALATRSLPLVQVLLEAGADPNDGVTLVIAASAADIQLLETLHAHGARADQRWATDGSTALYAILGWSRRYEGALWLLEHGADPNAVFAVNGETPFHAAARTGHLPLAESLLAHGGRVDTRRADGKTPYAIAELSGKREMAAWLLAQGASGELAVADRLTALCSHGDRAGAVALLGSHPSVRQELTEDHDTAFHHAAERGDLAAVDAFLAAGFDPSRPDASIGKTVLHSAAMAGQVEVVRLLLAEGASVAVRDREFHGQPLVWAAEGSRSHGGDPQAYAAVGRLLLDAGSPVEWQGTEEPSEGILEIVTAWQQR